MVSVSRAEGHPLQGVSYISLTSCSALAGHRARTVLLLWADLSGEVHVAASVNYVLLDTLATNLTIEKLLTSAQVAGLFNELYGTSFSERSLELTLQKAVQLS